MWKRFHTSSDTGILAFYTESLMKKTGYQVTLTYNTSKSLKYFLLLRLCFEKGERNFKKQKIDFQLDLSHEMLKIQFSVPGDVRS